MGRPQVHARVVVYKIGDKRPEASLAFATPSRDIAREVAAACWAFNLTPGRAGLSQRHLSATPLLPVASDPPLM